MALSPARAFGLRRARHARTLRSRETVALATVALGTTLAVVGTEVARVWRRGPTPLPGETDDVIGAAEDVARQSVAVALEGYRVVSQRENTILNLLVSFSSTFMVIRLATHLIRTRGSFGPIRNVQISGQHIHHFVPGIVLAFVTGAAGLISQDEDIEKWLAIPFGVGMGLTLDESALLLELEDVYWTEQGVVSVQITLAAISILGALALSLRLLRRGEDEVLDPVALGSPA